MIKRNVLRGGGVAILETGVGDRARWQMKFASEGVDGIGRGPAGLGQATHGKRRVFRWGRFECGCVGGNKFLINTEVIGGSSNCHCGAMYALTAMRS